MARRMATKKPKRPKAVKCVLIERPAKDHGKGSDPENPYCILHDLLDHHHGHLFGATIALAYQRDIRPDRDGRVWIVKVKKGSDLDRGLHGYDFVFILNQVAWAKFKRRQRAGALDHGLCRCGVVVDRDGELVKDEHNRQCYRLIKPDVVEFSAVIERHGFYTSDISHMATVVSKCFERNEPLWDLGNDGASAVPFGTVSERAALPPPSTNGNGKVHQIADWQLYSLQLMTDIPAAIRNSLHEANLNTLGELAEYTKRNRLTDIPGVGPAKAEKIEDALEKFWAAQKAQPAPVG
jgi:hypothetical protein